MRLLGYRIYYYCWKTFLLATFHASRHSNHAPPSNAKQAVRRKENRGHNGQASKAGCATLGPQGQPSARGRAPLRRCAWRRGLACAIANALARLRSALRRAETKPANHRFLAIVATPRVPARLAAGCSGYVSGRAPCVT